jgi:hypothetical protein
MQIRLDHFQLHIFKIEQEIHILEFWVQTISLFKKIPDFWVKGSSPAFEPRENA